MYVEFNNKKKGERDDDVKYNTLFKDSVSIQNSKRSIV
jgi:hypothetical protein